MTMRAGAIALVVIAAACQSTPPCASEDTTELHRAVLVLATRDMHCSADQITVRKGPSSMLARGCGFEAAYDCKYEIAECRATSTVCTYRGCAKDVDGSIPDQSFCP